MTTTIIGTVTSAQIGQQLIDELIQAGLADGDIEIIGGQKDEVRAQILERGFDEAAVRDYVAAIADGLILVAARAADEKVDDATAIIERYEGIEDESDEVDEEADDEVEAGASLLAVEEELAVDKRKVAQGGVRVTSSVSEKPVEKTVKLRTETVEVEKQPVSRKASPDELKGAFEEKTIEMIGTTEEVDIKKQAKVVGEVSLVKKASERQQTVKDTVRSSQVDVEKIGTKVKKSS